MEKEPRAKYVGRISYAVVELCGRGYCDMRGWGIWLLASQEPGEVNEPPPRRILFPSTTITHAESTNQERKQHRDSENKPTGSVSNGCWVWSRLFITFFPFLFKRKGVKWWTIQLLIRNIRLPFVDFSNFSHLFFQCYANPLNSKYRSAFKSFIPFAMVRIRVYAGYNRNSRNN